MGLLRHRDFQLLAGSVGVSALGDWLALVPLSLHIQQTTGSGIAVAALFIGIWSPAVLLAGTSGLLVDRFETRRLLAVVSLAQAAIAVALAFTTSTAPILVLATLLGVGYALAQPAARRTAGRDRRHADCAPRQCGQLRGRGRGGDVDQSAPPPGGG